MDKKKEQGKPLSPEIAKLSEKWAKDPKSRLFVPLAEEYLKSGMLHEAQIVLTDGLKIHPNFHTARTILGKVYLEKGQIAEAKAEFEQVIKVDPENLLAHRKLANLYHESGEWDKARISCRAVLLSSPKDPEMKLISDELDRIEESKRQKLQAQMTVSTEAGSLEMQVEQTAHATLPLEAPPVEKETARDVPPEKIEAPSAVINLGGPEPALEQVPEPPASEAAAVPDGVAISETETVRPSEPSIEAAPAAPAPTEEITTEALADLYIRQGFYEKGIAIYRRLLAKDPANQVLFKKLEETVELARLLNEGPQLKTKTAPAPEAPPPASAPAPETPTASPAAEPAPARDQERQKMLKIQRLQSWLDSIKKGQG
ncbi:MAG TPA: tetratricopeptide repeat protein [Nitrospiria bacterium]|nr:tetratricopeptide repeat protein [Nitrospiria bacterium]